MSIFFNKQITLFNRFNNLDFTDSFFSTVIDNVCVQIHNISNNNATNSSNNSTCKIYVKGKDLPKQYLKPKQWINSNNKNGFMTFKTDDYISIEPINTNVDIDTLYNQNDDVFKIKEIAYFDSMDSFQITAV